MGSVLAIKHITHIFPEIEKILARKIPRSLSMKTWISSTAKLTLHVLGADLTAY
ncbi:hypothetical protein HID58_018330, partial [Brassica napus]